MKYLLVLLALICGLAQAQVSQIQAFQPCGNTITFTANTSGNIPTPVQAACSSTSFTANVQYVVTNIGAVPVFLSFGTSANATANCVVPTSTPTNVIPILQYSQVTITTGGASYFCGITSSSTAIVYVTPGTGS